MYVQTLLEDEINKYFKWSEFACNHRGEVLATLKTSFFIEVMLTEFRIWYNRPMVPSSGFRTEYWNTHIKGSPISQHMKGLAADFHFPEKMHPWREQQFLDNVRDKWFELCDKHGVKGAVFYYDWGFHLDCRNEAHEYRVHTDYRT